MATVITRKQLNDIKEERTHVEDILPDNAYRIYELDNKVFLTVDVTKVYGRTHNITPLEIISTVEKYKKSNYKLYFFSYPFIILYKKYTFLQKIQRIFKKM